jgi:hypothetical protein
LDPKEANSRRIFMKIARFFSIVHVILPSAAQDCNDEEPFCNIILLLLSTKGKKLAMESIHWAKKAFLKAGTMLSTSVLTLAVASYFPKSHMSECTCIAMPDDFPHCPG